MLDLHFLPSGRGEGITEGHSLSYAGRESAGLPKMPLHSPGRATDEKTQAKEGKPFVHTARYGLLIPSPAIPGCKSPLIFGGHRDRPLEQQQGGPASHRPQSGFGREVRMGSTPAVLSP